MVGCFCATLRLFDGDHDDSLILNPLSRLYPSDLLAEPAKQLSCRRGSRRDRDALAFGLGFLGLICPVFLDR